MSSGRAVYRLVIPIRLHSLNEYIDACRSNRHTGAKMKATDQETVAWYIRSQLRGVRINKPVTMTYRWHESNRKRDLDNISSYGRKVIQDALVDCHVLADDGWKQIHGFQDEFMIDKKHPYIEVIIKEE